MPTQLYHVALIDTITLHYTAPLRLTISSHDVYTVVHSVLFGTIASYYTAR